MGEIKFAHAKTQSRKAFFDAASGMICSKHQNFSDFYAFLFLAS